jgi:hypothetical protein
VPYNRRKKVTLDGAEFWISPLTVEQVEQQLATPLEELQAKHGVANVYTLVCTGLNNAATEQELSTLGPWVPPPTSGDDPPAPEPSRSLKKLLDQILIAWLQEEILAFSGLRVESPAQGESSAAAPAIN